MKKIFKVLVIVLMGLNFGCQKTECGHYYSGGFCTNTVYPDPNDPRFKDLQDQINEIKNKISALENQNSLVLMQIAQNESEIANNANIILSLQSQVNLINTILPTLADQASVLALQTALAQTNTDLASLTTRVGVLEAQIGSPITGLQSIVNNNTLQITQLINNHNVTKIVDPCGNGPGYDEVFFRTSSGKLIASFSDNASGLNTRFSELPPGSYQTTDGTSCHFTVNPDMSITSTPAAVEY